MPHENYLSAENGSEFPSGSEVRLKRTLSKRVKTALFPEFLPNVTYTVDRQDGSTVWVFSDDGESYPISKNHLKRFYN